jgi:hypothetical protein
MKEHPQLLIDRAIGTDNNEQPRSLYCLLDDIEEHVVVRRVVDTLPCISAHAYSRRE